jgi:hypothetical protein
VLKELAGLFLIIWGYFDGVKYHFEACKIREAKSSRGHSRKFINMAIGNDFYRLFYFFFIDRNYYVLITSVIALVFMIEMFWELYKYYPYRMRGCQNFIRPNLGLYITNSLIPNKLRKRL